MNLEKHLNSNIAVDKTPGNSKSHCALLSPIFQISPDQGSFEGRVVVVCEKMMSQPCWASSNQLVHSKNSRGMTLLHLAAAQGYAGLIQTLIRWRWVTHKHDTPLWTNRLYQLYFFYFCCPCSTKHADSIDLELEVDPLNVDHFSCTPLVSDTFFWMVFWVYVSLFFLMPVCDLYFPLASSDVGMCPGPYWGSIGALPVGPKSSGYSWFAGTLAAQHRPIPGPHSIGWALRAAATDSSSSGPACWHLDGQMERRVTDRRNKQQSYPKP